MPGAWFSGMTLRDRFAIGALQGWLADRNNHDEQSWNTIANSCYVAADAMLKARKKVPA